MAYNAQRSFKLQTKGLKVLLNLSFPNGRPSAAGYIKRLSTLKSALNFVSLALLCLRKPIKISKTFFMIPYAKWVKRSLSKDHCLFVICSPDMDGSFSQVIGKTFVCYIFKVLKLKPINTFYLCGFENSQPGVFPVPKNHKAIKQGWFLSVFIIL